MARSKWRAVGTQIAQNTGATVTAALTICLAITGVSASSAGTDSPMWTKQINYNNQVRYKVPGIVHDNTSYMPIWYIMQVLRKAGLSTTWSGQEWDMSTSQQITSIDFRPTSRNQGAIVLNGVLQAKVTTVVSQGTTYMPVWYVINVLKRAGLTSTWDGTVWYISGKLSAHPSDPIVLGFAPVYSGKTASFADVSARAQSINQFDSFSATVSVDGSVQGEVPNDITTLANSVQASVYETVANTTPDGFSGSTVVQILSQPTTRATLIRNLVSAASQPHVAGINLDFENIPPTAQSLYTSFLADLHQALSAVHRTLSVDVPAETGNTAVESYNGAYNYKAIAQQCDRVVVMAYDYSYPGGPAGAIAPVSWVDQVMDYTVHNIPSQRVLMGLPTYAYDWAGGHTKAWSLSGLDTAWPGLGAARDWNAAAQAPYLTYKDTSGTTHTVFYENAQSIQAKLAIATKYKVAGVAVWRIGLEDAAVWGPIAAYGKGETSSP